MIKKSSLSKALALIVLTLFYLAVAGRLRQTRTQ